MRFHLQVFVMDAHSAMSSEMKALRLALGEVKDRIAHVSSPLTPDIHLWFFLLCNMAHFDCRVFLDPMASWMPQSKLFLLGGVFLGGIQLYHGLSL